MRRWQTPFDTRDVQIEPGQRVAYNLSGDVVYGQVVETNPYHAKIELLHDAAGFQAGHISRLRNFRSIMVIQPGDAR